MKNCEVEMVRKDVNLSFFGESSDRFVIFYGHLAELKVLLRQGWVRRHGIDPAKTESVADHIFSTTVMAILVAKELRGDLDVQRIALMLLIHDVGEALAGDFMPSDYIAKTEKYNRELASLEKIFENFTSKEFFLDLWKEYETQSTPESRFAKDFDNLDAALMARAYGESGLSRDSVDEFSSYASERIKSRESVDILKGLVALDSQLD